MQTRTYFIIAVAMLGGFTLWYRDYERRHIEQERMVAAAAEAAERTRIQEEKEKRLADAARMRRESAARQEAREAEAKRQAARRERREREKNDLEAMRDELAAWRVRRGRLTQDCADEEARLAGRLADRAALLAEQEFLESYITQARRSVARVEAVVAIAEGMRLEAMTSGVGVSQPRSAPR